MTDRERLMREYAPRLAKKPMPTQASRETADVELLDVLDERTSGPNAPDLLDLTPGTQTTTTMPSVTIYNGLPPYTTASSMTAGATQLMGLPTQEPTIETPTAKAFVTETEGKTLITAPASTWEKAAEANSNMLWMQGRFVGAEKANRNGAFWSAGDLELGKASVSHGPLNWLHEARHIIGTIADARYVPASAQQVAGAVSEPHITAASAIWKWIYPDEAWVVQQASEAQRLWYSMECISDSVQCAGVDGCGTEVEYGKFLAGLGCEHMVQRSTVRHFKNPTFLGGAVIVPPARPGWADADASTLSAASLMAEAAFDQAGQPDVPATEWEQLMAQVLKYAKG